MAAAAAVVAVDAVVAVVGDGDGDGGDVSIATTHGGGGDDPVGSPGAEAPHATAGDVTPTKNAAGGGAGKARGRGNGRGGRTPKAKAAAEPAKLTLFLQGAGRQLGDAQMEALVSLLMRADNESPRADGDADGSDGAG